MVSKGYYKLHSPGNILYVPCEPLSIGRGCNDHKHTYIYYIYICVCVHYLLYDPFDVYMLHYVKLLYIHIFILQINNYYRLRVYRCSVQRRKYRNLLLIISFLRPPLLTMPNMSLINCYNEP